MPDQAVSTLFAGFFVGSPKKTPSEGTGVLLIRSGGLHSGCSRSGKKDRTSSLHEQPSRNNRFKVLVRNNRKASQLSDHNTNPTRASADRQ